MKFGTDGIRGVANAELTPELALRLGRAAAVVLGAPAVVVGRDTRRSGALLEGALAAGLCAQGVDVELAGVVPTPAVAAACGDGVAGAMISASHNPFGDNGIKFFGPGGRKLTDEQQDRIEALLHGDGPVSESPVVGAAVGQVRDGSAAVLATYRSLVNGAVEGRRLDGLSIVVDCANGSNSTVANEVLTELGAQVSVIHAEPDGVNINAACGSTHPEDLCAAVVAAGADLGFAFDGDADRIVAVDAGGNLIDGDQLMGICAIDLKARNRLAQNKLVVTVMSNLGLRQGMSAAGIDILETPVGDRSVMEALEAEGLSLGGEQSGHIIFRDLATTGDGLLAAVIVADVVLRNGRGLGDLAATTMTRLPQVLHNVRLAERPPSLLAEIAPLIAAAEADLGSDGRILVRPSGTEPLIRVMVEAPDVATATAIAEHLASQIQAAAG
jgi:phosphoglucosamine mutase